MEIEDMDGNKTLIRKGISLTLVIEVPNDMSLGEFSQELEKLKFKASGDTKIKVVEIYKE